MIRIGKGERINMNILSVADIHGNRSIYKEIIEVIREKDIDVLILPGDLYPKPFSVTYEMFKAIQEESAREISSLFKHLDIPIYYVLGNDDWVDSEIRSGINLHGKVVEHLGIHFTGFEYIKETPFFTNRELSEDQLKTAFREQINTLQLKSKEPLVIVAHTPLFEKQDRITGGERVGSQSLRMEIENLNPLIYLGGHIHEDFGADRLGDTYVFNCACSHEIDLLRGYVIRIEEGQVTYEDVIR